jgi:AcrR family transcriptional regulator
MTSESISKTKPRVRITKDPDVRREELLDVALQVCQSQGFDALRVEQIVQTAGVAKGTFYHYFASKDAVGEALLQRFGDGLFDQLSDAAATATGSAAEQLRTIMDAAAAYKLSRSDTSVTSLLYRADNAAIRHRLFQVWRDRAREVLVPVITHGISDGSFTVTDAEATTDIVALLWFEAADQLWVRATRAENAEDFAEVLIAGGRAIYEAQERILGVAPHTYALPLGPEVIELTKSLFHTLDRTQS